MKNDLPLLHCDVCGCLHFGSNGCVYAKILTDPSATEDQKRNCQDLINQHALEQSERLRAPQGKEK